MQKTEKKINKNINKGSERILLKLFKIFYTFFKIGLFTFGGGFAMIPLMEREIVENHSWIEKEKFIDAISITQSVPGAVAVNLSIFFGYNVAGFLGALVAVFGVALPSFIIILLIAVSFNRLSDNQVVLNIFKGIRPAVIGLILYAGMNLAKNIDWSLKLIITFLFVFIANSFLNISLIVLIVLVIFVGLIFSLRKNREEKNIQEYSEGY